MGRRIRRGTPIDQAMRHGENYPDIRDIQDSDELLQFLRSAQQKARDMD